MSSDASIAAAVAELRSALAPLGESLVEHHPMAPLCTYKVGGAADLFVAVDSDEQLGLVAAVLAKTELVGAGRPAGSTDGSPSGSRDLVHIIGRGSNLLVADSGVRGLVIQLGDGFERIDIGERLADGVTVTIGAAALLPVAARRLATFGLTGFEWAVGIPGSVGGAVRMNAGGHGSELANVLERAYVVDLGSGDAGWIDAADLNLTYRHSSLKPHQVVTKVELRLQPGDEQRAQDQLSQIVHWRRENQPGGSNAGSVFTNPPNDSAGRLIDTAGCKGLRIGTAEVSTKHANFIQADPSGRADDVMAVMKEVVRRVKEEHGVRLHAETILLGFHPEDVSMVKTSGDGSNGDIAANDVADVDVSDEREP